MCSTHVATHTLARGPAARTPARAWAGPGRPPGVRRGLTLPRAPAGETTDLTTLLPHRFSCAVQFWTTEPQRRGGEETPVPLYVIGPPPFALGVLRASPLVRAGKGHLPPCSHSLEPQAGSTGQSSRDQLSPSPALCSPAHLEQSSLRDGLRRGGLRGVTWELTLSLIK